MLRWNRLVYKSKKKKEMLKEDNEGFVRFPNSNRQIAKLDCGKSMVYIVAFDVKDVMGQKYALSNLQLRCLEHLFQMM